jgi:hypothetical protein
MLARFWHMNLQAFLADCRLPHKALRHRACRPTAVSADVNISRVGPSCDHAAQENRARTWRNAGKLCESLSNVALSLAPRDGLVDKTRRSLDAGLACGRPEEVSRTQIEAKICRPSGGERRPTRKRGCAFLWPFVFRLRSRCGAAMSELSHEQFIRLYKRNRALSEIMSETRVGEVDGINFDLRHKEINSAEWKMDHVLGGDDGLPPRRPTTLAFIWFPWYGKFDPNQLKVDVLKEFREAKEYAKNGPPTPREVFGNISDAEYTEYLKEEKKRRRIPKKTWMMDELKSRTPDAIVSPGDSIKIHHSIMNIESADQFIPIHDRAFIHLFVKITNEGGLCNVLRTPIVMYGATRISYRHGNKGIYAILDRVRDHHKISKIDKTSVQNISDNYSKTGHAYTALYRSMKISGRVLPIAWKLKRSDHPGRWKIGMELLEALDDACMLGYAWAYAETEKHMRPLAVAGAASRAGAARAGQASGARRRAKAANTWQSLVNGEAVKSRATNPKVSQAKIAEEIKFKFDDEVPSHPVIVRYLARLEREGLLAKRRT